MGSSGLMLCLTTVSVPIPPFYKLIVILVSGLIQHKPVCVWSTTHKSNVTINEEAYILAIQDAGVIALTRHRAAVINLGKWQI